MAMMFTIITACYNSEKTIKTTIESLLHQTITNFEYIIVDGDSKDNTVTIIKSYTSKFQEKGIVLKWISEKDSGIYDAWNKGVSLASGDWVSFLGSDDYYVTNALENYYKAIDSNKNCEFDYVHSNVKLMNGEKIVKIITAKWSWKKFRRYMDFAHVGSFHNIKYFKKYGLFDSSYKIAGDYEFLLRAKKSLKVLKVNELTAIMSVGGVSTSNVSTVYKEMYIAKIKTGGINTLVCLFDYAWAFIKHVIKKLVYAFH